MKKVICLVIALMLLSTQVFAATYYDVTVEGLTYSEKEDLVEWLEDEDVEYDVESYSSGSSNTSNSNRKELEIEKLTTTEKNTLVTWLKNRDYDYSTKTKSGYYYITVEYTSTNKSTLVNYLESRGYDYDVSSSSNSSSDRTGKAYLVANGHLWYADGDEIEEVDSVKYPEYVLFTNDGGIAYINQSKKGKCIEDLDEPTESKQIANSVSSIKTNASGYATSFKGAGSRTTEIDTNDFDNDEVTVYVVKNNTLYSLSSRNKLTKLKSLKYVSSSGYTNIGFSEWGDLVFIDSSGVCFFNEEIDETDEIEKLKDQNGYSVQAKYLTVKSGIVRNLTLTNGSTVQLEDD